MQYDQVFLRSESTVELGF